MPLHLRLCGKSIASLLPALCALTVSVATAHAAEGRIYGSTQAYGTATACKDCGWVESCNWVESPDPVLVGAAASGRFSAQGQMLADAKGGNAVSTGGNAQPARYDIHIRMADGSLRLLQQAEPLPLGAAVRMQGSVARLLRD